MCKRNCLFARVQTGSQRLIVVKSEKEFLLDIAGVVFARRVAVKTANCRPERPDRDKNRQ